MTKAFYRLYELPKGSKIYDECSDGSEYFVYDHADGTYSYCKTENGGVIHPSASTLLHKYADGYKLFIEEAEAVRVGEYKIEKGVPLDNSPRSTAYVVELMNMMEIGDSFVVNSFKEVACIRSAVAFHAKKGNISKNTLIRSRRLADNRYRVWRVA